MAKTGTENVNLRTVDNEQLRIELRCELEMLDAMQDQVDRHRSRKEIGEQAMGMCRRRIHLIMNEQERRGLWP